MLGIIDFTGMTDFFSMRKRPISERLYKVGQARPCLSEPIIHLSRHCRIGRTKNQTITFQPPYGQCQHPLGDAIDGELQLSKAPHTVRKLYDHEN